MEYKKYNRRSFLNIAGLTLTAATFHTASFRNAFATEHATDSDKSDSDKPDAGEPDTGRPDAGRPNFIIIFTDDQGYQDVGCFGATSFKPPRLDQMTREGMKLTSFYSQPVCGPARAALMTGCYPPRVNRGGWNVMSGEITVAEVLKGAGYRTGCVGKWDISGRKYKEGMVPNDQGFDTYFGTLGANDKGKVTLWQDKKELGPTEDMGSLTGRYTDEAIRFIEKSQDVPFFLYLAHSMPHVIIDASGNFKGKSNGGLYGDVIEEIDWHVGRILDTLKELQLDKKTIVLFTSDNGPWLSKGEMGGSALPLRNGKGSSWEGGFRVPCIAWGPGQVPAGVESNALMATLDVMPTFAALAGAKVPTDRVIDGCDQSDFLMGKTDKTSRDVFYYYIRDNLHAVRRGKWKLALPDRKEFFKYAKDKEQVTRPELYDLESDISEKINLAEKHPNIVRQMLKLAERARQDIGDVDQRGMNSRKTLKNE